MDSGGIRVLPTEGLTHGHRACAMVVPVFKEVRGWKRAPRTGVLEAAVVLWCRCGKTEVLEVSLRDRHQSVLPSNELALAQLAFN